MGLYLTGMTAFATLVASSAMVASSCDKDQAAVGATEKVTLGTGDKAKVFTLKTALTTEARTKGLGGVKEIAADGGMIFVFPDSEVRSFWMYDCVIDLDIAYVDPLGIVTAVHTMPKEDPRGEKESESAYQNRLKRYSSVSPAQFAIEVRPGTLKELDIKRGTKIDLDLKRLKAAAKK